MRPTYEVSCMLPYRVDYINIFSRTVKTITVSSVINLHPTPSRDSLLAFNYTIFLGRSNNPNVSSIQLTCRAAARSVVNLFWYQFLPLCLTLAIHLSLELSYPTLWYFDTVDLCFVPRVLLQDSLECSPVAKAWSLLYLEVHHSKLLLMLFNLFPSM
jgi:hypothetical protein